MSKIVWPVIGFMICFSGIILAQSPKVINGGFESWTNLGSFSVPDNWPSSDLLWHVNGYPTQTVKSDLYSHSGKFAVRIAPDTSKGKIWPGFIASNFSCTQRPKILAFYHSDSLPVFDNAAISVSFTKFNTANGNSDSIGGAVWTFPKGVHLGYTMEEIEINWVSADTTQLPDTATIKILVKSNPTAVPQGHLLVDDVSLEMHSTGIAEAENPSRIQIYPNPAKGIIYIRHEDGAPARDVEILDMNGRLLMSDKNTNASSGKFDLSALANGIYLVKLYSSERIFMDKVVVER